MERCANCDSPIGKLETPHVFNGEVVCATCHRKLSAENTLSDTDLISGVRNEVAAVSPREDRDEIRRRMGATLAPTGSNCPSCGYRGKMKKKRKGSIVLLILLLLLWVLPGIFYAIAYNGYIWVCPKCGAKIADAT